ncbi:5-formyltetrahydrofolate cyclo-ligase [Ophiocordyceps camponoti-floridani]|uniref:5-formyltetrahydrofolate cyclo-ligase n=1 Tax=Ophiocordyceps camponoti-floridani TaxID=2030778 RepID=A0A8H4VFR0_9HYPO|nr:5-formyltetrahydrofolate cyclo-ligase [Ophiocordyceps camponoti-floridani]
MTASLVAAKQQLRTVIKRRLSVVTQESLACQSRNILDALLTFPPYRDAARISLFLSMPGAEVQTDAIVRHALACGKQVFIPYLYKPPPEMADAPPRVMDMVHLAGLDDYEGLAPDRWGIPSVDPSTVHGRRRVLAGPPELRSALDLMLLPGVAFDLDGSGRVRRLGHGRGFYDFFLGRYLSGYPPPLLLVGLALNEQVLDGSAEERVPVEAHDWKLNGLILGSGEVRVSTLEPVGDDP